MADGSYQLFTLAVDTRAPLLASSGAKARERAALEHEWARRRGIVGDTIKADSTAKTQTPYESHSPTYSGTASPDGNEVTTDQTDDVTTVQIDDSP